MCSRVDGISLMSFQESFRCTHRGANTCSSGQSRCNTGFASFLSYRTTEHEIDVSEAVNSTALPDCEWESAVSGKAFVALVVVVREEEARADAEVAVCATHALEKRSKQLQVSRKIAYNMELSSTTSSITSFDAREHAGL